MPRRPTDGSTSNLDQSPDFGGFTLWARDGVAVMMPTPRADWSEAVQQRYMARLEANLTGVCPSCGAAVDVRPGAPRQPAAATLVHATDCPIGDER
jgi:hypothetical protein